MLTAVFVAAAGALLSPCAFALEHLTLRNGQNVDCVRMEAIDSRFTRAYYNADGTSYQDFATAEIVNVEILPDPAPVAAKMVEPVAAPVTSLSAADLHQLLLTAGNAHNIDEDLLASVVKAESGGRPTAVSRTGAQGLMQLMPATAHEEGVHNAFRPEENIAGGAAYLDSLLKRYKDNLALALAAYNAGPGAVEHYHGVPPFHETRAYVARVIREFNRRKRASLTALAMSTGAH